MENTQSTSTLVPISRMPLTPKHWYILVVASLEQLIGAALSTIVGIMIPLILLLGSPELSSLEQGILGASGLLGIAAGSIMAGQLMDKTGYLFLFRLCPLVIAAGSVGVYCSHEVWPLAAFLFSIGLGVGGGYSLDSGYISELMPTAWESFFVGLAKATCSLGFIGGAAVSYLILMCHPQASVWPNLILCLGILGTLTFLLRIKWYQSPRWLLARGEKNRAEKAARNFFGPHAEVIPLKSDGAGQPAGPFKVFSQPNFNKIMLSGISWACEGLGVYGFGVFLPILVMALGLQAQGAEGIPKILSSVKITVFINIFIAAGFGLGLAILHKINIFKLMGWCFIICAITLGVLLGAFQLHWAKWISFLAFVVFEIALNAGPHLVTYIVPAKIYTVQERGIGTGIATMLGKFGAILGVFFMPLLLNWGGIVCVLWVSIIVQLIGAAVTFIYGKKLKLL